MASTTTLLWPYEAGDSDRSEKPPQRAARRGEGRRDDPDRRARHSDRPNRASAVGMERRRKGRAARTDGRAAAGSRRRARRDPQHESAATQRRSQHRRHHPRGTPRGALKYWDTSALVPLIIDEPRTPFVQQLVRDDPDMVVWWGTEIECVSAIARAERDALFTSAEANEAMRRLDSLATRWHVIQAGDRVRQNA